ncbi:MAG: alpha/beta hydrolase, partial [candidate division WOR-3 bacterium]|nr:alpha/beta hydrolase [candidate division WOR-3 bacterium]
EGKWEGAIQLPSMDIGMSVNFEESADSLTATVDIPQQGAFGLPLKNVSFDDPKVYFELQTSLATAIFDGKLEHGRIEGSFTQGPAKGEFYLQRPEAVIVPPPLYLEEEVSIKVSDDVRLAGTLSIPEGEGPFAVGVLISGSGPQDRDENVFGFKIFATIADHLTRQGIAVLRCDDRGVASSTGDREVATSEDYAEDVMAQVAYLKTRSEIDTTRIGLMGHSEGALIAGMVAADDPDIEFIILMAGTALPGVEILLDQQRLILGAEGASQKEIAQAADLQKRIFAAVRAGESLEGFKPEMRAIIKQGIDKRSEEERKALGDIDKFTEAVAEAQLAAVQSRWMRFFIDYDPRKDLVKVDARVLAFFGEKDLQVPARMNAAAMEETFKKAGKENYSIRICCKANHLFQAANTGAVSEYAQLPKEFVPCFLPNVTNFILGLPQVPCPNCKDGGCEKARTGKCPHRK